MDTSWEVVTRFPAGEFRVRDLTKALDTIHGFALENGLPSVPIKFLLKLLTCDRLIKVLKNNTSSGNQIFDQIISCMIPSNVFPEEDISFIMTIILSCFKNSLHTPYAYHLTSWFLFALMHGAISKKFIAMNFYVVLLVVLRSNIPLHLHTILSFIIKTVTCRYNISKRNCDLILEAWESNDLNIKKNVALVIEEFKKWNYLPQISLECVHQLVLDVDTWPLKKQFIHLPQIEEEPPVKMICPGLPLPEYDSSTFGQSIITFPNVKEIVRCLEENQLIVPTNPLSALATGPSQVLVAMMPCNSPWMKKLFSDAKRSLGSYIMSESLAVANALASLQETAKYPFPPLTDYWHSLANSWNGLLDSEIGKLLVRCIPYLHINEPEDIADLLSPLYGKFTEASLEGKMSILNKIAELHVNLVTLVVGRQEPVPFTGQRPAWALDPKETIKALSIEEEKFIHTFLKERSSPGRLLFTISLYSKIIMGEEVYCQVWTLPSDPLLSTWMTCNKYVVYESVCALLKRYSLFIVLLQKRGTSTSFISSMERLQSLTRDTYRLLLQRNLKDTWLGQVSDGAFDKLSNNVSLLHNSAFTMIFEELIAEKLMPSKNITEKMLIEKMALFAPECAKFLQEWESMNW